MIDRDLPVTTDELHAYGLAVAEAEYEIARWRLQHAEVE